MCRSLSADQPELHAKRRDSLACSDFAQSARQGGSSPSVLLKGVFQQSGFLVVWSLFRPPNVGLKFVRVVSTSHTVQKLLYCICAARAACCKFHSSSTSISELGSKGTHGNQKMAICRLESSYRASLIDGE